jgi:hypothetical protein
MKDSGETLSVRELMERNWATASLDEKVGLLVEAYEAFARSAAEKLKADFILPNHFSYQKLLRTPSTKKQKRRLQRTKATFRKLAEMLDDKGIFYREYLKEAFDTWSRPAGSKASYRLTFKVPAAFPLPQHLLDERVVTPVCRVLLTPVHRLSVEEAIRHSERFVAGLLERNPRRYPNRLAVFKDPYVHSYLPPAFLRQSPEVEELFRAGYYRIFGAAEHTRIRDLLTEPES